MALDTIRIARSHQNSDHRLDVAIDRAGHGDLVASDGLVDGIVSGSVRRIEVRDTLERLSIRAVRDALGEWRRWLAAGGELDLVVAGVEGDLLALVDDSPFDHVAAQQFDAAEANLAARAGRSLWTMARLSFELASVGFAETSIEQDARGTLHARARTATNSGSAADSVSGSSSSVASSGGSSNSSSFAGTSTMNSSSKSAPSNSSSPSGSTKAASPSGTSSTARSSAPTSTPSPASLNASIGATRHVVAAPDVGDLGALTQFLAQYGPVFAGRTDLGLALLFDPAWSDHATVASTLERAHAAALGAETLLEIALVPLPRDEEEWHEVLGRMEARIGGAADPRMLANSRLASHSSPVTLAAALGGGLAPLPGVALDSALCERAAALHPWFYPVELAGHVVTPGIGSPCTPQYLVSRTQHRMQLLIDSVLSTVDMRGKRVLDLASNCGFWSSAWAVAGAAEVFGIEGRAEHVEQARLYWSSNSFLPAGKWRFEQGDIASAADWRVIRDQAPFDVTLCAGILYHVRNWDEILRWAATRTRETLIVDTRVQDGPEVLIEEPGDLRFNAIESTRLKVVPNRGRLLAVLGELGFDCDVLEVPFATALGVDHDDDYAGGRRITVVARKVKAALPSGTSASGSSKSGAPNGACDTSSGMRLSSLLGAPIDTQRSSALLGVA
jgi:SAM-dependent methyltransferase